MTRATMSLGRQAQRSKGTRDKILDSAISLIKEVGFSAASASRIAERAGITWGAAQHHFGSKEEIYEAVMAISHEKFVSRLSSMSLRKGTIADRVDAFIECMWAHYQDDVYLAGLEILLASREIKNHRMPAFDARGQQIVKILRKVFQATELSDTQIQEILIYVHCLLTGLTIEKVLEEEIQGELKHLRRCKMMVLSAILGI